MKITFGKHKGLQAEALKRVDVDYLRWGAKNLKSSVWRREFQRVLNNVTDYDEACSMAEQDGITVNEALAHIENQRAIEEQDFAYFQIVEAKQRKIVVAFATKHGVDVEKIHTLARKYGVSGDYRDLPASMFSSNDARASFVSMMDEFVSAY